MNNKIKMKKSTNTATLKTGIVLIILLAFLLIVAGIAGCQQSEGRNIGGTIWGNTRAANNPDRGIGNALLSFDDTSIFAITKSDGYFSVTGLPDGNYNLTITKFGFEIFNGSTSVNRNLADRFAVGGDVRFAQLATLFEFPSGIPGQENLAGTLVDPDGMPIQNAEVDLIYAQDGYFQVVDTDHAGSFYFTDIMPNPDYLFIEADGFKPAVFTFEQIFTAMQAGLDGALVNIIPLSFDEPESIEGLGMVNGTIQDNLDKALSGIKIALYPYDPEIDPIRTSARITTTDESGSFVFEDVEPGEYVVWAGHPNYFPKQKQITLEEGVSQTVVLNLKSATETEIHPFFNLEARP